MSVSQGAALSAEGFFSSTLGESDPEIAEAVRRELWRQRDEIELIASENIVSRAVLEAQGSVLTNKYAEGLPGKRYYGGCEFVDVVEQVAIDRAKKLFGCSFANVQPHSGASANAEVFMALMQPGDTFMGLNLAAGGHLTHGSPGQPVRTLVQAGPVWRAASTTTSSTWRRSSVWPKSIGRR